MNVRRIIQEIENNRRKKYPKIAYTFDRKNPKDWLRLQDKIDEKLNKLLKISQIINQV
jgi:hypothetical protein